MSPERRFDSVAAATNDGARQDADQQAEPDGNELRSARGLREMHSPKIRVLGDLVEDKNRHEPSDDICDEDAGGMKQAAETA
jgi:hypothetical protein